MKKYLFAFFILFSLSFFITNKSFADTTAYQTPTSWNCSGGISCTGLPFSWTAVTGTTLIASGSAFTFPSSRDVVDGIRYKFTINSSSAGWSYFPFASIDGINFYQQPSCGLSNNAMGVPCQYNTVSGTTTNGVIGNDNTQSSHIFTRNELESGNMQFKWSQNGGAARNITISNFQVAVDYHYPQPTISVSSATASQGAQTITLNLSGDTTYTQTGEQCKVSLYEQDVASGALLSGVFANILLDANNPRTTTFDAGGGTYNGYGFTSTVSTWSSNGVSAPLYSGHSVQIVAYTRCYHQTTNSDGSLSTPINDVLAQGLNSTLGGSATFTTNLIATPSALTNLPSAPQQTCNAGDYICDFKQWLYNAFNIVFGFNSTLALSDIGDVRTALNSKAPFSYINSVLSMDLSATGASTASPTLTFTISKPNSYVSSLLPSTFSWNDGSANNNVAQIAGDVRVIFTILLWLSFVFYIFFIVRRIF